MKNFRDLEIQKINNMNLEKIIEYANNNTDLLENNLNTDKRDIVFEIYKYADLLDKLQNDDFGGYIVMDESNQIKTFNKEV